MQKSRLDPGLNPRDWARANENDRQLNLEQQVVTAVVRSTDDPAAVRWLRMRNREERGRTEPFYGLDWLNRRSPVAFGTRKFSAERTFAGMVSRLWKPRERDSLPEISCLADLLSSYPEDMPAAFVARYPDHTPMYCFTTIRVEPTRDDWAHTVMLFPLNEGGERVNVTLCPLDAVLEHARRRYGAGYLRLEGER